jgi:hypothetical protein
MSAVFVRDIAGVAFPRGLPKGRLLMLSGYFDDSGTHDDSSVVAWGGLLGTESQWEALEKAWRARLSAPLPGKPPLRKFGVADCRWHDGEFSTYTGPESDHLRFLFRSIIAEAKLIGVSAAVCRADYDELIVGELRRRLGDSEMLSFGKCILYALDLAPRFDPPETQIALTFDLGRKSTKLYELIANVLSFDRSPLKITHIGFSPVELSASLQAADTVATESYWAAKKLLAAGTTESASAHFRHYLATMQCEGSIADREVLLALASQGRPS